MAIFVIQPVPDFSALAGISSLQGRNRAAKVDQAPLVATPSVVVTLGTSSTSPLVYDSAGLLPASGSAAAPSQNEFATAREANTDTSSLRRTSAEATIRALGSLLTSDLRLAMTALGASFSSAAAAAGSDLLQGSDSDNTTSNDVLATSVEIPTVALRALTVSQTGGTPSTLGEASIGVPLPDINDAVARLFDGTMPTNVAAPGSASNSVTGILNPLTGAPSLAVATTSVPTASSVAQLQNVANDPNVIAANSVARDPSYAAAAAAFYLSAAAPLKINAADAGAITDVLSLPMVLGIPAIRALKPV